MLIIMFTVSVFFSDHVNSEFTITPKNRCAFIGEKVELHCSSNTAVMQYWYGPAKTYISQNYRVQEEHKDKYYIDGSYSLHISNFTFSDAGMYKCEDSTDMQHPYTAEVIAIGRLIIQFSKRRLFSYFFHVIKTK